MPATKNAPVVMFNEAVLTPELSALIYDDSVEPRFRYELLSNANVSKGFLNCILTGGSLECTYLADIKRKCAFTVGEFGNFELIDFLNDRVKIYYDIWSPYRNAYLSFPLGVYVLAANGKSVNKKLVTRSIQGFDLTQVLKRRKHLTRYIAAIGSDPIALVRGLLDEAGIAHNIEDNPDIVNDLIKAERSYDPGSEFILTINDLLRMINYRSLWMDNNGIATSGPYVPPSDRLVEVGYITDNASIVADGANLDLNLTDVPNIVTVVVSQPDRPVIVGTARNDNPDSPTSTVNAPENVYVSSDNEDVTTQEQATARARNLLAELSQIYETIAFDSAFVPLHGENTILGITYTDLDVSAVFSETEWKISLTPGELMSHSARRLVQV